ncbi:indolethylamine N-methyltransferase-like [Lampetra fluviatilis]
MEKMAEQAKGKPHRDYHSLFSARAYLERYYEPLRIGDNGGVEQVTMFNMQCLHEAYIKGPVKGTRMLDVGCGPTIYQLLFACDSICEITMADFTPANRREVKLWRADDPSAYNWDSHIRYACQLQGTQGQEKAKAERLRRAIKHVLPCDVLQSNIVHPEQPTPFDVVQSSFCLECACDTELSFRAALRNMAALLVPGGWLVLIGALDQTVFVVAEQSFAALPLSEDMVRAAVSAAGLQVDTFRVIPRPQSLEDDLCDISGFFFLLAKKG